MKKKYKIFFWISFILLISFFLRLHRISETTDFNYDQARSATFANEIAKEHKLILIGPDSIVGDKTIYHGPLYFYLIAPGLKLSEYDPISADYTVAILGIVAVLVVYFLTKNLLSTFLFAVFPISVIYSRWAWSPNPQPLFAAIALLFVNKKRYLLAGIFCGLTIQLHILAGAMLIAIFAILLVRHEIKKAAVWILFGTLIGFSPVILFNVRHSFIGLLPLLQIFSHGHSSRGVNIHYFLWTLPFLALFCNRLPSKFARILITFFFIISLYIVLTSHAPPSRLPSTIEKVSQFIIDDQKKDGHSFNIASFVDPDTRATPYRYFLGRAGKSALGIDQYKYSDHIYVLSFETGDKLLYNQTYEIASFKPTEFVTLGVIDKINIYKFYNK